MLRLVCDTLRDLAEEKRVEIHIPSSAPPVVCDRAKLYQMFQNLISNAIRYCDPDKTERWVRVEIECDGSALLIHVCDNGLGMDETELRELFQPFRRGRNTRGTPGMGLGLAIAQRIAQACGGGIRADSIPGQGSRMTIALPLSSEPEGEEARPLVAAEGGARNPTELVDAAEAHPARERQTRNA
jgi:signal transduction histidine kinase